MAAKRTRSQSLMPPVHNWRTTDEDEINRRRERAGTEDFKISNLDARHPIFSNFRVQSASGMTYQIEVRDLRERQFYCDCVDFRINGLGTCKHVEAVLLHLQGRFKRLFAAAVKTPPPRLEVVLDPTQDWPRLSRHGQPPPRTLHKFFDDQSRLLGENAEEALTPLRAFAQDTSHPHAEALAALEPMAQP